MPSLKLIMEGDGCWPDLSLKVVREAKEIEVACLLCGMQSGKTSVTFRLDMPDGDVVLAQTSLELLEAAVRAFRANESIRKAGHEQDQ